MCRCSGETMDHLLIHCPVAYESRSFALSSFGIRWALTGNLIDLLFGWRNWVGKDSLDVWKLSLFMFVVDIV